MRKLSSLKMACAALMLFIAAVIALPAKTTFTNLVNFDSTNGANPLSPLVQGTDGNLYGMTLIGGAHGDGTIFKMTPTTGKLTTIHSFDGTDGSGPYGTLVLATDGNFYGTTASGGTNSCNQGGGTTGCGTVFKITPAAALTTLHSFDFTDGSHPNGLVQATDGNFYGTTFQGGTISTCNPPYGCGTVFKITTAGKLTTLHNFDGKDGSGPLSALIQATDGNLYGTTRTAAHSGSGFGDGTVFKITIAGKLTTLYNFCSKAACKDGSDPYDALVQAADGNLYGTTAKGGTSTLCTGGCGAAFKITTAGALTTLYDFCSLTNCTDSGGPEVGLTQATDRNFYGSGFGGGANVSDCTTYGIGCGAAFELVVKGSSAILTTLHSFDGTDGAGPGWLTQATSGEFYGITLGGGTDSSCTSTTFDVNGCGTIFSLSTGLGSFVETNPTSGKVGSRVIILGTNLKGATTVTFNGTAAMFKVVSSTEITTTVPTGATTGTVEVATPGGTLKSNVAFRVR